MGKMQTDFEAAYCEQFGRLPIGWNSEIERYMDAHAAGAWWAWQASRADLVVELPPITGAGDHWSNVRDNTILSCKRAIEAAGLRVKA